MLELKWENARIILQDVNIPFLWFRDDSNNVVVYFTVVGISFESVIPPKKPAMINDFINNYKDRGIRGGAI